MLPLSEDQPYSGIPVFTLSELNTSIKTTLELAFPESVWVVAEISEIRCNTKGHCYLELVEREEEETIAQIRANIWAYTFRSIASKFEKATRESLKQGMKVLLQVNVTFHEVYGLSLNIKQAMLDLEAADKNIGPTQKAVEQAEENLRVSQERYKAQVTTSTEVLDAQTLLNQVRMNYYNALYNHILAKARLQRAIGER